MRGATKISLLLLAFVLLTGCKFELVKKNTIFNLEASTERVHSLSGWQSTSSLTFSNDGAHDSASFAWNGFMYLTGGQYGTRDRIQRAPILSNGQLGAWVDLSTLGTMMPRPNQDHLAFVHQPSGSTDAFIYIIGGWDGGALSDVRYARILPDGNIGAWQIGPSLIRSRHGHTGSIVGNRIYILGGWSNGALDSVEYVTIQPDGSLLGNSGQWLSDTSVPQALTFASAIGTPLGLWVMGGENQAACPNTVQETIYHAQSSFNSMDWQLRRTLPEPMFDQAAVFTKETVVLTGGAFRQWPNAASNCPWFDATISPRVYFSYFEPGFGFTQWESGPDLPAPRADHSVVVYNSRIYVLGGRSVNLDPPYPSEVWFSEIQ